MWARLEVAKGAWSFFMALQIIGYDVLPKLTHLMPKTGNCPVTRSSAAAVKWAISGATDGEFDYYSKAP